MKKVRVRYIVKQGNLDPDSLVYHSYEMDLSKRESALKCLEEKLEGSLNDLERLLKRRKANPDS